MLKIKLSSKPNAVEDNIKLEFASFTPRRAGNGSFPASANIPILSPTFCITLLLSLSKTPYLLYSTSL